MNKESWALVSELSKVCVGGTFDMMHKGHRRLLSRAFEEGRQVVIGVTSDSFLIATGKKHDIQPYAERVEALRSFLSHSGLLARATIVPLDDPYGPSATDPEMKGIVVSTETAPQAAKINRIRRRHQMMPLEIFVVDMVAADDGQRISSTRIRLGQIDEEGHVIKKREAKHTN